MNSRERMIDLVQGTAHVVTAGNPGGEPVLFLQGGVPGMTPYCGGAHVWGNVLDRFAQHGPIVAVDLPGSGGTPIDAAGGLNVADMAKHVVGVVGALGLPRCHVVGHDFGGLVALQLAMDAPSALASVSIVASAWAAPSGDGVENLTLAHPPQPLWGAQSQFWALDRLSYAHAHIDRPLVAACVEAGIGAPHRRATDFMASGAYGDIFMPSVMKAKSRFFAAARTGAIAIPVQIVWAANDPLSSPDHGLWLFRIVGAHQPAAQYHLINRSGSFVFREQPEQFAEIVLSFQAAVSADAHG